MLEAIGFFVLGLILLALGGDSIVKGASGLAQRMGASPFVAGLLLVAFGTSLPEPSLREVRDVLIAHLEHLHAFYGEPSGVRIARKHLGWYAKDRPENTAFRAVVNRAETAEAQLRLTRDYFDALIAGVSPELPAAA